MIAIRQIREITAETLTVQIPKNFPAKRAEIIILPLDEPAKNGLSDLQRVLLNAPTLNDDELHRFENVRDASKRRSISIKN